MFIDLDYVPDLVEKLVLGGFVVFVCIIGPIIDAVFDKNWFDVRD